MIISLIKTSLLSVMLVASFEVFSSINPSAISKSLNNNAQMVNLNFQFRSRNKTVRSNLTMPFYQTAEFEKMVGDKNVLVELNPRRGKNADEISLEMKLYRVGGSKPFYKKDFIARINEESTLNMRDMSVRVKPVLN
jgi:hypothetical protein